MSTLSKKSKGKKKGANSVGNSGATRRSTISHSGKKRGTTSKQKNRNEQMNDILDSPELRDQFRQFMKTIYAEENILFYDEVTFYENVSSTNQNLLKEKFEQILSQFILTGSPHEINISKTIREEITSHENPFPEIFETAKDHIYNLMCKNSLPLFTNEASDEIKLVSRNRISLPPMLVEIIEALKQHDPHGKHFSMDVNDPKLHQYLLRTSDMTFDLVEGIKLKDIPSKILGALLKKYLGSRPVAIITAQLPIFFEIVLDKPTYLGQYGDLRELINVLPPRNQAILHFLIEFLFPYKQGATSYNDLGEIFAPLLLKNQRNENKDTRTIAYIIEHYEELFMTSDFRYIREGDIIFTKLMSYPQISLDLFKQYEDDIHERRTSRDLKLTNSDWDIIFLVGEEIVCTEETVIIENGVPNDHFYIIKKGSAYVDISDDSGNNSRHFLSERDIFGELSVFINAPASATVMACANSVLSRIHPPNLTRLFNEDQVLSKKFYFSIAFKLARRLLHHDPARSKTSRLLGKSDSVGFSQSEKDNIEYYQEKFGIEDDFLKDFEIKNGLLWIGRNYICTEELTLFSNKKNKAKISDIGSIYVEQESLSFRIEKEKKKRMKFSAKNKQDYKRIIVLLETLPDIKIQVEDQVEAFSSDNAIQTEQLAISDIEWEILLGGSSVVHVEKDERVISQGKSFSKMYILARGSARADLKKNGTHFYLGLLEQGDIFGDISFISDSRTSCNVIANEDSSLYCIHRKYIELIFQSYPNLATKFYRYLCRVISKRIIQRENQATDITSIPTEKPSKKLNRELTKSQLEVPVSLYKKEDNSN